jgi:Inclusion body protein
MAEFNVHIAIDALTIAQVVTPASQDPSKPTGVSNAYVSVMQSVSGPTAKTIQNNILNVEEDDEITFWVSSAGFKKSCYIYNFIDTSNTNKISDSGVFSMPIHHEFDGAVYMQNKSNASSLPIAQPIKTPCWKATVNNAGSVMFGIQFIILKNTGEPVGYFEYAGVAAAATE